MVDLTIDCDEFVTLKSNFRISGIRLRTDPLEKMICGKSCQDVTNEIFWESSPLLEFIRKVSLQFGIIFNVTPNLSESKAFILRNINVLNRVLLDIFLFATDDVF